MSTEKDEVSTRLRLPVELHHKLGALAKLDNNRSLHNYMIKVLRDHVYNAELKMQEAYSDLDFDHLYKAIFGTKYDPYFFEDEVNLLLNPPFSAGATRATGRRVGKIENSDKPTDE